MNVVLLVGNSEVSGQALDDNQVTQLPADGFTYNAMTKIIFIAKHVFVAHKITCCNLI